MSGMKNSIFAFVVVAAGLSGCCVQDGVVFEPGRCEIVVAPDACSTVQVAAEEAKTFLGEALGAEVPVVSAPTPGKASLVLGANSWADAAGVTTNGLKRDAFRIRTAGGRVFVVGIDDAAVDARKALARGGIWLQNFERATCFGVYEFLERFVGVRFYFPGELGTVVPRRAKVEVPATDMMQAPDFTVRRYSIYDYGRWFEGENPDELRHPVKTRNWWRLRMETEYTPCCHGQNKLCFIQRFAKSHPEYFALLPDGRRHNSPKITYPGHPGQICHSSTIWDEIYLDVKSYLMGEPASVRGIPIDGSSPGDANRRFGWGSNCQRREIVDVMPQDGMIKCSCEKCKAYYESTPDKISWASGLLWPNVAKLANRLKAEGVPGKVAMMAYSKYRHVPEVAIPDNVEVMVAERGPWTECDPQERKREMDEVKAWYDKLGGRKVWMWTYANRGNTPGLGGIPEMTPHAVGRFFQQLKPYIFGAFLESENDWSIFSYLNYYVFAKVCWDNSADVDAIIDEHHRLMFGSAAAEMGKLYSELERIWLEKVAGKTLDTPLGPQSERPSEYDLFMRIYTPAVIDGMEALLDAAAAKVADGSIEFRRIAFVRENIFAPLARRARAYVDSIDVQKGLARDRASKAKNLIGNGDFSAPKKGRQMGPWFGVRKPGVIELDDKVFTSAPYSMRIVPNTNEVTTAVFFFRDDDKKPTMKPGRKYRLSYCIKIEDLRPAVMHGGAGITIWDDKNIWIPVGSPFSGTQDWTYQTHEFTAGPNTGVSKTPYIYLRVGKATGTVWFDDVRLEEL